jgi:uncharacterized YigZ family protein
MVATEYYSISGPVQADLVVKGSKFIAQSAPTQSKEEAEAFVQTTSLKYQDATHNCFSYKVGVGDATAFRFRDAGEPSGTAGRPILQAIEKKNLTNLCVVVTRYYGGTKLGTGGLVRAYGSAALAALNCAEIVMHHPSTKLLLRFSYEFANLVHQAIDKFNGQVLESRFEKETVYLVELTATDEIEFQDQVRGLLRGKIDIDHA